MKRAFLLVVVGLLAACGDVGGFVEGPLLEVPDCNGTGHPRRFEPFRMELAALSVHEWADVATIRMASRVGHVSEVDQLGLVLYDVTTLRQRLRDAEEVPVALVVGHTDDQVFTAEDRDTGLMTFVMLASCGRTTASLAGIGTLVMTAYGDKHDDVVAGRFDIDVIDRRTGVVLGPGLHGEFDLVVDTSTPNTAFAPKDY